jgi:hypothetical protein
VIKPNHNDTYKFLFNPFRVVSFLHILYLCYSDSTLSGLSRYLRVVLVLFRFNPIRVASFFYGLYLCYSYSTLSGLSRYLRVVLVLFRFNPIRVVSLFTGCTCVIHIQPISGLFRFFYGLDLCYSYSTHFRVVSFFLRVALVLFIFNP